MADFRAVEALQRRGVVRAPELTNRVRGNRDAALPVDRVDGVRRALAEADALANADRDQVVIGIRENLFALQHDDAARRARECTAEASVEDAVMAGDGDRVEPLPLGLEDEPPRRQRAVAPHRAVRVQIDREHAIAADFDLRLRRRAIGEHAGCKRRGEDDGGGEPAGRHHRSIPTIIGQSAKPKKYTVSAEHASARCSARSRAQAALALLAPAQTPSTPLLTNHTISAPPADATIHSLGPAVHRGRASATTTDATADAASIHTIHGPLAVNNRSTARENATRCGIL